MSLTELDTLFGPATPPPYVGPGEETFSPRTLACLDAQSAKLIKDLFATATEGLGLTRLTHECCIVLWLLDENGEIWFALEEVTYTDELGQRYHHPISRSIPFDPAIEFLRLGHPSLIAGERRARIGGEIVYDESFGTNGWIISNKSGRYGSKNRPQKREHLEAAARVWEKFGITMDIHYLGVE
ncbi:hypothetical protein [Rhizobium rhizogenes]|nr:hypothetical protein [Rhizobium rhizogenes]NTG67241.1 hypothetical protein [Rhizobium rhizogenes]TRB14290.1 hypothetical protein EXN67_01325 [Rhizobium rhizogenes]TRB47080.1 hypothetical protein EXN73_01325 [Rhizobium rhizogenes]TRB64847.1 hypothetical protein EXN71_01325 [Rhizobium rhizogenes]